MRKLSLLPFLVLKSSIITFFCMRNTYTEIWLDLASEKSSKMENTKSNWIDLSTFSNFLVESNRKDCQLCNIPVSYESKSKNRDIVISMQISLQSTSSAILNNTQIDPINQLNGFLRNNSKKNSIWQILYCFCCLGCSLAFE